MLYVVYEHARRIEYHGHPATSKRSSRTRNALVRAPGPAVSSPLYADGHLYFTNLNQRTGRQVWCLNAKDGQTVYRMIFDPSPGVIYASPLLADGKLYYVSEKEGTFVVAAEPDFKLLAHNVIATDDSVFNASPAPLGDGKLLLRSDKRLRLYCVVVTESLSASGNHHP